MSESKKSQIIKSFADAYADCPEVALIPDRMFLVFAACAFFSGAEQHLQKMADIEPQQSREDLINTVQRICGLGKLNAEDAINNIDAYARKYYVIEHISEQGEIAADEWLSCQENAENPLQKIINKYQNLTLADLGIEGVNPRYQLEQKQLFASVDRSVGKLRRRNLLGLLLVLTIIWSGLQVIRMLHH